MPEKSEGFMLTRNRVSFWLSLIALATFLWSVTSFVNDYTFRVAASEGDIVELQQTQSELAKEVAELNRQIAALTGAIRGLGLTE